MTSSNVSEAAHRMNGRGTPDLAATHWQNCSRPSSLNTSPSGVLTSYSCPAHALTILTASSAGTHGRPFLSGMGRHQGAGAGAS